MFLVKVNAGTDLSHVDLRGAETALLPLEARAALKWEIEQAIQTLYDPERGGHVLARLEPVLREPPLTWELKALPRENRRGAIVSADAPEPIRTLMGATDDGNPNDKPRRSPGDDGKYGEALARGLAQLVCYLEDDRSAGAMAVSRAINRMLEDDRSAGAAVASRLMKRMRDLDGGAYLPDLACHLRTGCPDLVAKLDAAAQQILADAAAKATGTGAAVDAPCAVPPAAP